MIWSFLNMISETGATLKKKYEGLFWALGIGFAVLWGLWSYIVIPQFKQEFLDKYTKVDTDLREKFLALNTRLTDIERRWGDPNSEPNRNFLSLRDEMKSMRDFVERELGGLHNADSSILKMLKNKISEEVDSTYYFEKTFTVDPMRDQPPLQQFFYATATDRVILSIWQAKGLSDISVSVNGGAPLELSSPHIRKQGKRNWQDVDLTEIVRDIPLQNPMMPDIPPSVSLIDIRPRPITPKKGESFEIHALLIVKRGAMR